MAPTTHAPRRTAWVDVLRGALVLLVVVWHCVYGALVHDLPVPMWLQDVMQAMQPFRMPLLLLLSGMFLHRGLAKPAAHYLRGKIGALLWPYLIWFALFYFVLLAGTHQPTDRWYVEIVEPATPLWFVGYLFAYFVLALPLRTPSLRLLAMLGALAWVEYRGDESPFGFWHHFACFLAGSLIVDPPAPVRAAIDRVRPFLRSHRRVAELALLLAAAYPVWWGAHRALELGGSERTAVWLLPAVGGLVVGRWLASVLAPTAPGRWLASLGPLTIVVLLAHTALLAALPTPGHTLTSGAVDSVFLSIAVALAVGLAAVALVRRYDVAWLAFDLQRGVDALVATNRAATGSAQSRPHVQSDLGVDQDLLRGGDAVDDERRVGGRVALQERERHRP